MAIYYRSSKKHAENLSKAMCDVTGNIPTIFKDGKTYRTYRIQENEYGQAQMDLKLYDKNAITFAELCEDAKVLIHDRTMVNLTGELELDAPQPDEKFIQLWKQLYCTLTSSQIDKAIRAAGLQHDDWMEFCSHMEGREDNETVCTITWAIADIREALLTAGYKDSDENVKKLMNNRVERTLQDVSVQYGWEILHEIVTGTEDLEVKTPELISCQDCGGTGRKDDEQCDTCWGTGLVSEQEDITI